MQQHKSIGIQALLLRTFLPAVLIVAMSLAVLVYNLQYAVIMDGFDRKLMTASAITGSMIDPADHDFLINEAQSDKNPADIEHTERYLRNVEPMRNIREKLDLTYLYTQALGGEADIFYILDSSLGDDHSPIGSEDELPAETLTGLHNAEMQGGVYISPVEYQKQWGLLKTAAAPVYGADGTVTATAGADVDISVIQIATQNALFASAIIGMISILACLFVTLQVVQRIARPIETLKQEALRIAAGDYHPPAKIRRPREAAELRNTLAKATTRLTDMSASNQNAARTHQRRADAQCLTDKINANASIITLYDDKKLLIIWIPIGHNCAKQALVARGMTLLREKMTQNPDLAKRWEFLTALRHGVCVCFDRETKTLRVRGGPVALRINDETLRPSNNETIDLSTALNAVILIDGEEIELLESMTV